MATQAKRVFDGVRHVEPTGVAYEAKPIAGPKYQIRHKVADALNTIARQELQAVQGLCAHESGCEAQLRPDTDDGGDISRAVLQCPVGATQCAKFLLQAAETCETRSDALLTEVRRVVDRISMQVGD